MGARLFRRDASEEKAILYVIWGKGQRQLWHLAILGGPWGWVRGDHFHGAVTMVGTGRMRWRGNMAALIYMCSRKIQGRARGGEERVMGANG